MIDHPNRFDTHNGQDIEAAGTSVKGDRLGHQWTLKSIELPRATVMDSRYHVTLTDTKRNYVAKQADITYATIIHGYEWVHFEESEELSADTILSSTSLFRRIVSLMRQSGPDHMGWTLTELTDALGEKSDGRIRAELRTDLWRISPDGALAERVIRVKGGGVGRGNVALYALQTRAQSDDEGPVH